MRHLLAKWLRSAANRIEGPLEWTYSNPEMFTGKVDVANCRCNGDDARIMADYYVAHYSKPRD